MATTIVNLTSIKVMNELENILTIAPTKLYQEIANNSDLKQKLIAYILRRMPNKYITVNEESIGKTISQNVSCSTWEQFEIEELVKQGIYYLINSDNSHGFSYIYRNTM
jgi:hypothetical protein